MSESPTSKILVGNCIDMLREIPDASIDCIVTSPPYWGLRDYGCDGQIGLEATPQEYVAKMVDVFEEARRVLKLAGTCWVNMGDTYAGSWGGQGRASNLNLPPSNVYPKSSPQRNKKGTIPPKNLIGVPWRLALGMQDAGWILRSEIIWSKLNPMPSSVADRPTTSHEHLFLFAKNSSYFYDASAIAEPAKSGRIQPVAGFASDGEHSAVAHNVAKADLGGPNSKLRVARVPANTQPQTEASRLRRGTSGASERMGRAPGWRNTEQPLTRNARTVWEIATEPFRESHFATFPREIPRRCILAGCPQGGVVLDPFLGSGTTVAVAIQLGRHGIGIELNPEYAEMARRRIASITPGFLEVA